MIYALLGLTFVACLLLMQRRTPNAPLKYGALVGLGITVTAWSCNFTQFEPGPTPPLVKAVSLGWLTVLTGWMLVRIARSSAPVRAITGMEPETMAEWIRLPRVALSSVILVLFPALAGALGYGLDVAMGGTLVLFLLSFLFGPRESA